MEARERQLAIARAESERLDAEWRALRGCHLPSRPSARGSASGNRRICFCARRGVQARPGGVSTAHPRTLRSGSRSSPPLPGRAGSHEPRTTGQGSWNNRIADAAAEKHRRRVEQGPFAVDHFGRCTLESARSFTSAGSSNARPWARHDVLQSLALRGRQLQPLHDGKIKPAQLHAHPGFRAPSPDALDQNTRVGPDPLNVKF
jgi:hypothetical protein